MNFQVVSRSIAGLIMLADLTACHDGMAAQASNAGAPRRAVAAHSRGETIFRLQNAVMDQLITAQMESPPTVDAERLDLAGFEYRLVDHCTSLNEAAGVSASGGSPGVLLKVRVLLSLSGCERSAVAARDFLAGDHALLRVSLP